MNIVLIIMATSCTAGLTVLLVIFYKIFRIKRQVEDNLRQFVSSPGNDKPSPLAETVQVLSQIAGRAIAMEIKTTLMGRASGDARNEKAIVGDIVKDSLSQNNPIVGAIMQSFPSLTQRLIKNPALGMIASNLLGGLVKSSDNGKPLEQIKFKM